MRYAINGACTMPYELEQDIRAASEAGFEGVELWWPKLSRYLSDHSISELVDLMEQTQIKPAGICPFLVSPFRQTGDNWADFTAAIAAAHELGCQVITVCPDFRPVTMSPSEALNALAVELRKYAGYAADMGLKLAIESIGGHSLIPGPAEALTLIEMAGGQENLGLVADSFHYAISAVGTRQIQQIPADRLYIVHVNDSEEGMADELKDANRRYPCEGCLDLRSFMGALGKIPFEGYYSVEVFRPDYWREPIDVINARAFESMRKLSALI